jgi:hypothetical protein
MSLDPSLDRVSFLRTKCAKFYEELFFLLFSTITMIHDDDNGLLTTYVKQNRVNTQTNHVSKKHRSDPSVSRYRFSEGI